MSIRIPAQAHDIEPNRLAALVTQAVVSPKRDDDAVANFRLGTSWVSWADGQIPNPVDAQPDPSRG